MQKTTDDLKTYALDLAKRARTASRLLTELSVGQKDFALSKMAELLRSHKIQIKDANAKDLETAERDGLPPAMIDRLKLNDSRIEAMAVSIDQVARQTDPVGQIIEGHVRPNDLKIEKVRVPIGVIAIIFESRPNVTADAAALCLRSSNACILRGGKEAIHTNLAIAGVLREALGNAALPIDAVQLVESTDRNLVPELLQLSDYIDLVIPRGGESLIRAVVETSKIPVIKHYTGNCHIFVDKDCSLPLAEKIIINAKCQRPGVCNAVETILFHRAIAETFLPAICEKLARRGVEIRGCPETKKIFPRATPANDSDWSTEYLDLVLAVKVVSDVSQAIDHINNYGSHHTDAILTDNIPTAEKFVKQVDSASVMVNTSTRFSDGYEYGLGAEVGISTDKLHARGPMGAADLTTYKYVVRGNGQIRE
ncbi:MAG: glutamate-5-semialdehyde dehydrogenase [Phycisphaerae bacterium]